MADLTANTSLTVSSSVIHQTVGDEAVLLDLNSEQYYGLDAVGQRIWALVCEGKKLDTVIDKVTEEYDVAREVASSDTHAFVSELVDSGLLVIEPLA